MQVRQRGTDQIEHRKDVRAERPFELRRIDVGQALLRVLFRRVAHHDVDLAERGDRLRDDRAGVCLVAQVAGNGFAAAARCADEAAGLVGVVVFVQVRDQHIGAFLGKADGDRAADAAVAAGDDGHLVCELAAADVIFHFGLRAGGHVGFSARLTVLMLWRLLLGLVGHGGLAMKGWRYRLSARAMPLGARVT
ncbi:hypothetical protein ACUXMH_000617 [Ralstonia pickettii]